MRKCDVLTTLSSTQTASWLLSQAPPNTRSPRRKILWRWTSHHAEALLGPYRRDGACLDLCVIVLRSQRPLHPSHRCRAPIVAHLQKYAQKTRTPAPTSTRSPPQARNGEAALHPPLSSPCPTRSGVACHSRPTGRSPHPCPRPPSHLSPLPRVSRTWSRMRSTGPGSSTQRHLLPGRLARARAANRTQESLRYFHFQGGRVPGCPQPQIGHTRRGQCQPRPCILSRSPECRRRRRCPQTVRARCRLGPRRPSKRFSHRTSFHPPRLTRPQVQAQVPPRPPQSANTPSSKQKWNLSRTSNPPSRTLQAPRRTSPTRTPPTPHPPPSPPPRSLARLSRGGSGHARRPPPNLRPRPRAPCGAGAAPMRPRP